MSRKNILLEKLWLIAENPENPFDGFIAENKMYIKLLSEDNMLALLNLREKCRSLCRKFPFEKEYLYELADSLDVESSGRLTELIYSFSVAEHIFNQVNGKDFTDF